MWEFVKVWVAPGTLPFLGVLFVAGVILASHGATKRLGQVWLAGSAAIYLVLSLPWTAGLLSQTLQGRTGPLVRSDTLKQPVSVVVLGGDHAGGRIREVLRLYRELRPTCVVLSGAPDMQPPLMAAGVPADRIINEATARTTREQALNLPATLRAHSITEFVLVASAIQMPRALAAVRAVGLRPIPSASPVPPHWSATGRSRFLPHRGALILSAEVVYEYLALAYYGARGWLS
jgi:uncharacterized SAM-binding protein YcdF (DUF218 family)